jgi:8-oxo-dGTP diphosphatase
VKTLQAIHPGLHQRPLQVVVGVIKNASGQILITLRDKSLHQGGLWEFPGGKIEAEESAEQALVRELKEELDIDVKAATPLISIRHDYPDLTVQLHVFSVETYSGLAKGCEGQPVKWVEADELVNYAFPAANQPIITAARLPPFYAILDDADPNFLLVNLETILSKGIKMIQARLKTLSVAAIESFLEHAYPLCKSYNASLLMNSSVKNADSFDVDGIHLTSVDLLACKQRPENKQWVAASCHNIEELQHAQKIGVDFVVLAPVLPTPTHPDAKVLGWDQFAELIAQIKLPVYALGGLYQADLLTAQKAGGQGIAAVRAFLE